MKYKLIIRDIKEPICGWQWVYQHYHDLDGWQPSMEMSRDGSRFKFNARNNKIANEAIKEILR